MNHPPRISIFWQEKSVLLLHSVYTVTSEMTLKYKTIIVYIYPYKSLHLGHQQDAIKTQIERVSEKVYL